MPTRHLRDHRPLLKALHNNLSLDVSWPASATANTRDDLDALDRAGLRVKRTVNLTFKSLPPHKAESFAQNRLAGYVGPDDRLLSFFDLPRVRLLGIECAEAPRMQLAAHL